MGSLKQKIFVVFEELTQLRYERPILGWIIVLMQWLIGVALLITFMWWLASTSVGNLLGLTSTRDRITYAYYSLQWARKGVPAVESMPFLPQRYSGTIERASQDMLLVTYYEGGKSIRRIVKPSNVVVEDTAKFKGWAEPYLLKPVTIDFYAPLSKYADQDVWSVVLWVSKKPINVELVEQHIGVPEINPITTAVNQIYSQYYFQKAMGN